MDSKIRKMNNQESSIDVKTIKYVLVVTISILTVFYCSNIIMPIVFSGVMATFLTPFFKRLTKMGINPAISSFIAVGLVVIVFSGIIGLLAFESQRIIETLPKEEITLMIKDPQTAIGDMTSKGLEEHQSMLSKYSLKIKNYMISALPSLANEIKQMMFFLLSIPIYIFFILLYRNNLKAFYYSCLKNETRKSANVLLKEVETTYQEYLKGLILVLFIVSVLTTLGLYFIGIQNALFLGVLSGILTLIPYFGVVLSALIPVLIAVLTKESMWYPLSVLILYAVIQFIEGNLITPKIIGDKVDINPLMIILGVMIFGTIAGVFGMILTIPLLALLKIVASHNETWKPLHLLLESRNK